MKKAIFELKTLPNELVKKELKFDNAQFVSEELSSKNIDNFIDTEILICRVNSKIDKKVLDKLKNLKMIQLMSTGFNNVNIAECKKRNIKVCNIPSYSSEGVAEHSMALLFALSRKIIKCNKALKECKVNMPELIGFQLKNKTIGILGTGRIGIHMAKLAKGVGMKVLAFDVYKNKDEAKKIGFKYVEVDKLYAESDVISLHLPLNDKTKYLVNKKVIKKFKKGVVLINTARGKLVKTEDLLEALNTGRIMCAGLDVLEDEHRICENKVSLTTKLIMHPNVTATPHAAFNTTEAVTALLKETAENIRKAENNKELKYVIKQTGQF